jgi:hypothetical protein
MVYGGLLTVKPNFDQMTRQELKRYILENREDNEALTALINREDPNAPRYPFPKTEEDMEAMMDILKDYLNKKNNGNAA